MGSGVSQHEEITTLHGLSLIDLFHQKLNIKTFMRLIAGLFNWTEIVLAIGEANKLCILSCFKERNN